MKKLTEDHFKILKSQYPVLSVDELAQILGGDAEVSWNCVFLCMYAIDRSRSVEQYVEMFSQASGLDPSEIGGVPTGSISSLFSEAGFEFKNNETLLLGPGKESVVVYQNSDGTGHAVLARSEAEYHLVPKLDNEGNEMRGPHGNVILESKKIIKCYDLVTNKIINVPVDSIGTIFQVKKPGVSGSGSGSSSSDSSD